MAASNPEEGFRLNSIARAETCFPEKFGVPRQGYLAPLAKAFLRLNKKYQPEQSLQGLEGFSHLWVLFWCHRNEQNEFHAKIHPPRLGGKSIGVFATRSPHHPNPIGMTLVKIDSVAADGVWVSGIDFTDGTPILDIKPFISRADQAKEIREGWVSEAPELNLSVQWTPEALQQLYEVTSTTPHHVAETSPESFDPEYIQKLFAEVVRSDPRPLVYRGKGALERGYRTQHDMRLYHWDIRFEVIEESNLVKVTGFRLYRSPL